MALRTRKLPQKEIMRTPHGLPTVVSSVSAPSGAAAMACMSCEPMGQARQKYRKGRECIFSPPGQHIDGLEMHIYGGKFYNYTLQY